MFSQDIWLGGYVSIHGHFPLSQNNWKITEAGKYDVKLNVLDNTMSIIKNVPSAISSVNANGEQAPVEYYTLEGMRVNQPVKGIYIMRQGNKVVKVSNK